MEALQATYDMKIKRIKVKGLMTVWFEEDGNTVFTMTFLSSKKKLKDCNYVTSTIIKDEK